jgi:hypothetical protein
VEHGVGDAFRAVQVELRIVRHLVADEDDVAQHGEQMLVDALDHLAVDEGDGRRTLDVELDAALALDDGDIERLISLQQFRPSSMVLPQLSTASAQRRKTLYRPPWLVSSSLFTSALERTSRRPSGEIRVSTTSCSMMRKSLKNRSSNVLRLNIRQVRPVVL